MLTPDTINDIESDIEQDNFDTLMSSIENFKITLDEYKTKLPDLFNRIESSEIKIDKVSALISDKTQVAHDTLFSGITQRLDELVSDIAVQLEDSFTEIKKTTQKMNENTTRTLRFKKCYDTGKIALVWILIIFGIFFLFQYFMLP